MGGVVCALPHAGAHDQRDCQRLRRAPQVAKLNVDHFGEIAARYQIRGIPTILVFNDGEVHDQMVGAGSKENIVRMVEKVAASKATA